METNKPWSSRGCRTKSTAILSGCVAVALCATLMAGLTGILGCASTSTRESTGEFIDDSAITTKVKASLAKDPVVSAMQVKVVTYKGVVQLSGFVDTKEQANRAAELARGVDGVKNVENRITVKTAAAP